MNYSKTLIAQATKQLGNEAQASALQAIGRALKTGDNATKRVVKAYADANTHPSYFVSPYDKQGNVNPASKSQATPAQYDAQSLLFAAGIGACNKGLLVNTSAELFALDIGKTKNDLDTKKEAFKNTKDKAKKTKLSKEIETISATLKARNELKRTISPKFRDLAGALITEYKRRAKAKDGHETANELATQLKAECGFKIDKSKSEPKQSEAKDESEVIVQQATNLLNALQGAENPPANINKLVAELNKLIEPKH